MSRATHATRFSRRAPLAALAVAVLAAAATPAVAGEADVLEVAVERVGPRAYRFDVRVAHADAGWHHFADRWEILGPDGALLATRVLRHPHVSEQPFTRSLPRVRIPVGVEQVQVRAHDSVHGHGGRVAVVPLPAASGGDGRDATPDLE